MKFQTPVRIQAEVKTPVFIGDGEEVSPLSYIAVESVIHVVDTRRFFGILNSKEQEAYLSWIESILNRQQRRETAELSLGYFLSQRLKTDPVAFVKKRECVAYSVQCSVRPENASFRSFIKEAGYRPYVPGTELKGALRTALLLVLFKEGYGQVQRELDDLHSMSSEKPIRLSGIASQLERRFLRGSKNDAKYDLLKLIQVSDGELLTPEDLRIYVLESVGTQKSTRAFAEGLKGGTTFSFYLSIAAIEEIEWALAQLGLAQKAKANLNLDRLMNAIYRRSALLLKEDKEYFRDSPDVVKRIEMLETQNRPEAPLLRLGTGQGFLSVTVTLPVRQRDPQLYEAIREEVSRKRRWRTRKGNFPKTRRVISDGKGRPLAPPGYIQLSIGA